MKRVFAVIIIILAVFILVQNAQAQKALKIGIVEVEKIVEQIPEAKDADIKLQTQAQIFRDSLASLEKIFLERAEKYNKQKAMMNADQQKKEEESLQKIQIDYQKFQQEKLGAQGELAQMREALLSPIREKVREAIKKVAVKENMSYVFDKSSPMLLFAEDQFDITFSVLDQLKRGVK